MNEKLLQQAMAMFDSQEKWDAFLELCYSKDTIRNKWREALKNRLKHLFGSTVDTDKWQFDKWVRICPKELNWDHMEIRINLEEKRGFLFINQNWYNPNEAIKMIQNNPIIMPLLKDFEYHNDWDIWNKPFDRDICTTSWESSCYMWAHDTERVANVIFETYMRPFMTDKIADLFVEICEATRK